MTELRARHVRTTLDSGSETFDIRDQKGRVVGYKWRIDCVKVETAPKGTDGFYYAHDDSRPLVWIEVHGSPTRDGNRYGPAFNTHRVETTVEAQKVVAQRINNARKRDTKKFVKVA